MKCLAYLSIAIVIAFGTTATVNAATTTTTTTTKVVTTTKGVYCKPTKKIRHHRVATHRIYYSTGKCVSQRSSCNSCRCTTYCYPAQAYNCHTELNYRHGRNHAKVEVCH